MQQGKPILFEIEKKTLVPMVYTKIIQRGKD